MNGEGRASPSAHEVEGDDAFITQKAGRIVLDNPVAVLSDVEDDSLALTAEEELKMKNTYILATTALLKKQKEMKDIERLLASKRVEFAARSQELQSRREELEAKQRQLKDRVIKFERFLKENDAKRERANQRVIAEQKQRGLRVQEIESLQEQLRREELMLARTVQTLQTYKAYENYLQSVVDILPPDYLQTTEPGVSDVLMRYQTLSQTENELRDIFTDIGKNTMRLNQTYLKIIKDRNNNVLLQSSQLGSFQEKLDKARNAATAASIQVEMQNKTALSYSTMLGSCKLTVEDLYLKVRTKQSSTEPPTLEGKLAIIQDRIIELADVAKVARESTPVTF